MIEVGTAARKSVYDVLNGAITYSSNSVPVGEKLEQAADQYIILGAQSDQDKSNKSVCISEVDIELVVVTKNKSVSGKKIVEDISNVALGLVIPSHTTHGLTIISPFKISFVKYTGGQAGRVTAQVANMFENTRTLNFRIRITQ